jgi:hypothetical protein
LARGRSHRGARKGSHAHGRRGRAFAKHSGRGRAGHRGLHRLNWTRRYWNLNFGAYLYYNPDDGEYYYWCQPDDCYYPEDYCPYGRYDFDDANNDDAEGPQQDIVDYKNDDEEK